MISSKKVNDARVPDASSSFSARRRSVLPFENDRINRGRILVPRVHGNRIPEQSDVITKRGCLISFVRARTFLHGPGFPPQREAGSINRISGDSLIIHLCTPIPRMANPCEKGLGIFSISIAPWSQKSLFHAIRVSPSYPWNAVVNCCERITDPIARTIVVYLSGRSTREKAAFLCRKRKLLPVKNRA